MTKPTLVERAPLLSLTFLLVGLLLTMVGTYILSAEGLASSRGWSYWLISIGLVLLLIGVLWILKLYLTIKKFQSLLQEKSKATFLKNLDRIEYTAWKLPSTYEKDLATRKEEFNIK